jgi:hypothetical protein
MAIIRMSEFGEHGARCLREVIRLTGRTIAGHAVWTLAETVRKHFPNYKKIETVLRFRSIQSMRRRSIELGVAPRQNMWTTNEIARFKKLYPTTDWPELLAAFPRRTKRALGRKATRKKRTDVSSGYPVIDAKRIGLGRACRGRCRCDHGRRDRHSYRRFT